MISVVFPVRNAERTASKALNSILAQTYRDFEVLAIDDGSTDASLGILSDGAARDARVRVLSSGGCGLTAALNLGIQESAGRYVARQDADDVSLPERFARQVACLDTTPALCAVGTAATMVDESGRAIGPFPMRHGASAVRDALRSARATPVHGAMMIRRESLAAAGGYREAFVTSQDFDLWLRLSESCDIDNLDVPLYQWRISPGSIFGSRRQMQLRYAGIALAFAAERARFGHDSYTELCAAAGDLDAFVEAYRLRGLLRSLWGELLLRGTRDVRAARRELTMALLDGHVRPSTLFFWAWTRMGLSWRKPLTQKSRARGDE